MPFKLIVGKTMDSWRGLSALAAAVALLVALSACPARKGSVGSVQSPVESESTQHVNASEAQKVLAERKATVLDVRTPDEFASGHIPGAVNIDFHAGDFEQKIAALDKTASYLVHCASGNRSRQSLPLFEKQGFQHIYHLDGGLHAWENAGLPIEK
jgi:rhodanese-related sulfurtransferase